MISVDEFMRITEEWSMEEQLVFLAENQDWCDLFFQIIYTQWESIGDTMEYTCIEAFANGRGLKAHIPRDE